MTLYEEPATERWVLEPPKRRDRTPFERDRARVLHSAALRRLAAKTQVVDLADAAKSSQHSPRTRLTHSLECAQIGRELGKALGCDPDLVETACLAHDLGHPPFGHNGEAALDTAARGCGGFEGNAQSLRILTRLEPKTFASAGGSLNGRSVGLNLTRAVLDASMKYPWGRRSGPEWRAAERGTSEQGSATISEAKYGFYADDAEVAGWVRAGAPEGRSCFEAQVMDWSDDVAYSVHDLEDALHGGHVHLAQLGDPGERRMVCELAAKLYCDAEPDELEDRFGALLTEPFWPTVYDGSPRALAALKNLTSELIGRFCRAAEQATRQAFGGGALTRYVADLVVPRQYRLECALLKAVAAGYVFSRASHGATQARQRELIIELAVLIERGAPGTLDAAFHAAYLAAGDAAAQLRVVVDQVASLTDTSAVAWHRMCKARGSV